MLSVVILTRNEEHNIKACIESIKFCDEILVIDDYSHDRTVEIAKSLSAHVLQRKLNGDFATQRNFGLEKAKGDWILFVDADERVSPRLKSAITTEVANLAHLPGGGGSLPTGFYLRRQDVLWGKTLKHGESGNIKLLRLAKRMSGKWKRKVHEVWEITGDTGELKGELLHYPHQSIGEFLTDINVYSTLHAQENMREGKRASILKVLLWPKLKFLQNFVFKLGFLDGGPGFVVAMMMSFHSFLAWGKLWLIQRSLGNQEIRYQISRYPDYPKSWYP